MNMCLLDLPPVTHPDWLIEKLDFALSPIPCDRSRKFGRVPPSEFGEHLSSHRRHGHGIFGANCRLQLLVDGAEIPGYHSCVCWSAPWIKLNQATGGVRPRELNSAQRMTFFEVRTSGEIQLNSTTASLCQMHGTTSTEDSGGALPNHRVWPSSLVSMELHSLSCALRGKLVERRPPLRSTETWVLQKILRLLGPAA